MKLLFITQKIDKNDDILGVYHEWAREIAKHFEKFSVICLYEGRNELPEHIEVFSLGKETNTDSRGLEHGFTRIKYLLKFYHTIWKERKNYDSVFVHMNPIYVVLGWPIWRFLCKDIFLFYAHYKTGFLLRLAQPLCKGILTSVPESCGLNSHKVKVIGQGIDTERFSPSKDTIKKKSSILFVGRISSVKKLHVLIDAFAELLKQRKDATLSVVGAQDYGAEAYALTIRQKVREYGLEGAIRFVGKVPNSEMPKFYNEHEIFVNLTQTGSFDKAILEAMSCGCLPVVSNAAYKNIFPREFHGLLMCRQDDASDLVEKMQDVLFLSDDVRSKTRKRLREIVMHGHSLSTLGSRLRSAFKMDE